MALALLLAALACALAVGCGSDSGRSTSAGATSGDSSSADASSGSTTSDQTSGAQLTKAEFIKQGDAICVKTDEAQAKSFDDYLKENGEDTSKAGQEALVIEVGLPAIRQELKELRALGPPAGDEDAVEEILGEAEDALVEAEEKPSLALRTRTSPFSPIEKLLKEYGFKACGIV